MFTWLVAAAAVVQKQAEHLTVAVVVAAAVKYRLQLLLAPQLLQ
jgi:hypothetical protein